MSRSHGFLLALPLALIALHGCKRGSDATRSAGGEGSPSLTPPPPGTLFPTGAMLRGDRASLQHYLRYVDTVADATVRVTYAPQTVLIGRNAAIRSLHSASWDGVAWRFDSAEPAVRRLVPGSVMLVWGLAIRRVTRVDQVGDEIVLTTEEAQLTDAVTDADISWNAPAHLLQGAMAMRVPKPVDSVQFLSVSTSLPEPRPALFRLASLVPEGSRGPREPGDSAKDPPALYSESFKLKVGSFGVAMAFGAASDDALNYYAQFAWGEDAEEPVGLPGELDPAFKYGGKFADWVKKQQEAGDKEAKEGKKTLKDIRRTPSEEVQLQKEEEEAEAEYQKKYGRPSRRSTEGKPKLPEVPKVPTSFLDGAKSVWGGLTALTAIKITSAGTVTGFRSKGDISIKGGQLEHATLEHPDFHLATDIYWAIRLNTAVLAKHTHLEIPVTFRVPLIVAGLPLFLEVAVNAQIQPALTSRKATATGHRHVDFRKGVTLMVTPGGVSGEAGEPTAVAQKGPEERITGIGVSGLMIALQVPRIGLGFGIIGSNITSYFDVVVASGSTYTGTTGIIQCTHSQLVANFNVGVSATFLGFPLGDKRNAGPAKRWDWDDPEGRKCG